MAAKSLAAAPANADDRTLDIAKRLANVSRLFALLDVESGAIAKTTEMLISCLRAGGKVMFCGNGGSAADCQHLATELMGRYMRDRRPLSALSLTVDTSALTAIANDYGFEQVFARQLLGIGRSGDVLVGISTSGSSANVLRAMEAAHEIGIRTVAFTGESGGKLAEKCDVAIKVPSSVTNEIQEMHIVIGHMICGYIEEAVC